MREEGTARKYLGKPKEELITLWKDVWKEAMHSDTLTTEEMTRTFCQEKQLQVGLLDSWIKNNSNYPTGRFEIIKYLLEAVDGIKLNKEGKDRSMDYYSFLVKAGYIKTWDKAINIVIQDCKIHNTKKYIVFIDGDNLSSEMHEIELLDREFDNLNIVHVSIVFGRAVINEALMGYESRHWLSIVHASTKKKDAADICIAMMASSIHHLLLTSPKSSFSFAIVTKDHFAEEVKLQLELCHRKCDVFDNLSSLMAAYKLAKKPVENPIPKPVINVAVEPVALKLPVVTEKPKEMPTNLLLESEPSDTTLREFYNLFWLGTGKSSNNFCKNHNLDSSNFSKFIRGLKNNTSCKNAVLNLYLDSTKSKFSQNGDQKVFMVRFDKKIDFITLSIERKIEDYIPQITIRFEKGIPFSFASLRFFSTAVPISKPIQILEYGENAEVTEFVNFEGNEKDGYATMIARPSTVCTLPLVISLNEDKKFNTYVVYVRVTHKEEQSFVTLEGPYNCEGPPWNKLSGFFPELTIDQSKLINTIVSKQFRQPRLYTLQEKLADENVQRKIKESVYAAVLHSQ